MAKVANPRTLALATLVLLCVALAVGCNDTLRQFITPVPPPGGDPCSACLAHAVVLSTNPAAGGLGSDLHIDVSGDTAAGVVTVGPNPVFLGRGGNRIFVINGNNTLSAYIALLPNTPVSTVTQPATVSGSVAGGTSSAGNFFVTNEASNNLSLVAPVGFGSAVTGAVPVGTQPVSVAGNAANNKIYVVNQGSNDVTVVSTIDNTVVMTIPVGSQPIWGVMSTDGVHVFVVNQGSNNVSVIDALLDKVITTVPVGPSPNFAFYDGKLQRLYVTNTGNNTVSVIKANGIDLAATPQVLPTNIANVTVSGTPISVTALTDGTRAYAALGNCPAGTNHLTLLTNLASCTGNLVSVIDATALRESKTIPVGAGAVSIDAATDASRVYVVSALDTTTISDNVNAVPLPNRTFTTPSISVIKTSTDTVLAAQVDPSIVSTPLPTFHAPQQDPNCKPAIDPGFNSKIPMPCPLQVPFMVRMFP